MGRRLRQSPPIRRRCRCGTRESARPPSRRRTDASWPGAAPLPLRDRGRERSVPSWCAGTCSAHTITHLPRRCLERPCPKKRSLLVIRRAHRHRRGDERRALVGIELRGACSHRRSRVRLAAARRLDPNLTGAEAARSPRYASGNRSVVISPRGPPRQFSGDACQSAVVPFGLPMAGLISMHAD